MRPIQLPVPPCPDRQAGTAITTSPLFQFNPRITIFVSQRHAVRGWSVFAIALIFLFGSSLAKASTYYLSPNGSDSNSGTTASASWVSPNHSLNCGDVIVAAAGTNYSASNFYTRKWGTVNCPAGNNVAWLKCATFDGCKIHTTANQGMWVDKSYWGVEGWEVTTSSSDTYGTCFTATPGYSSPQEIHHIIFANDVANGCSQGGFTTVNRGNLGVDYFAVIGSIAYNAAQGSATCTSGISIYQPVQSDSASGTHIYVAGNFSYGNIEPDGCAGRSPTDGEGIIFDAFDGSQGGLSPYAAQAVAYNNIVVNNGAKGIEVNDNSNGSSHSTIWFSQNTSWGNLTDPHQSWYGCGEISLYRSSDTHVTNNLVSTRSATACGGHPIYALAVSTSDGSDAATNNFAYGYNGNNTFLYDSGSFSYGSSNHLGTNPNFANPVAPGAPQCGGAANVPSCMASVVSDFTPKPGSGSVGFGYQKPSSTSVHDSLFPHWLCSANLPAGLVSMGCS
jgi:hypothetical protein